MIDDYSAVGYIYPGSTIVPGEASAPLTCPFSNAQVKLRCHRPIKPFLERNRGYLRFSQTLSHSGIGLFATLEQTLWNCAAVQRQG